MTIEYYLAIQEMLNWGTIRHTTFHSSRLQLAMDIYSTIPHTFNSILPLLNSINAICAHVRIVMLYLINTSEKVAAMLLCF